MLTQIASAIRKNFTLIVVVFLTANIFLYSLFIQTQKKIQVGRAATLPGDCGGPNGTPDGYVDLFDYGSLARSFGLMQGQTGFNAVCDFYVDSHNIIDLLDYGILAQNFGKSGPTNTTTPRPTGPTPTTSGSAYRPFTNDSYWNTPMPANAPIDLKSSDYINDSMTHYENYLGFSGIPGNTAYGWNDYWASSNDPLYTLSSSVQVHIPLGAKPSTGSDGELNVFDLSTNQNVAMWKAIYNSSTNKWSYSGLSRFILSSNGLDKAVAGSNDSRNSGHRGIPGSVRGIRVDEVRAGAINHRLECYWWATGTQATDHYWPMTGSEGAKGGIVPEGIVIRIKQTVNLSAKGLTPPALVIAKAMQQYGCLIGDNSGGGNKVKLEINDSAWNSMGLTSSALSSIPWTDWEFIKGGYDPVTNTVR